MSDAGDNLNWKKIWDDRYYLILETLKVLADANYQRAQWSDSGPNTAVEYYCMLFDDYKIEEFATEGYAVVGLPTEYRDALMSYAKHLDDFMQPDKNKYAGPDALLATAEWQGLVREAGGLVRVLPSLDALHDAAG